MLFFPPNSFSSPKRGKPDMLFTAAVLYLRAGSPSQDVCTGRPLKTCAQSHVKEQEAAEQLNR